jgi:hypothetical protein
MGYKATAGADVGQVCRSAAIRLFATPRAEVDLVCRLTLTRYLKLRQPGLSDLVSEHLFTATQLPARQSATQRSDKWLTLRESLNGIRIVDPTCGQGHFLLGMLRILNRLHLRAEQALGITEDAPERMRKIASRNLYGVEVDRSALELTAVHLQRAVGTTIQPLRLNLICGDSLVERGEFSWDTRFPETVEQGGFDLVVGNPPYVRHEIICDPLDQLPTVEYRHLARAAVYRRLSDFFGWNAGSGVATRPLDGRSDLSVLFTYLGFSLLRPGGILGFVLPAAALETRYGQQLREFLRSGAEGGAILESSRQRSFSSRVNTVVLLGARRGASAVVSSIRHLRVSRPWSKQTMVALQREAPSLPRHRNGESDSFGLRLLERLDGRLTSLGRLGRLRYPVKTGINRFFYPDPETVKRFGIEPEFCSHIVRSPREVERIALSSAEARSVLFVCENSLDFLMTHGKLGALAYIRWGADQTTAGGVPWPLVPSVRGRAHWYAVLVPAVADILCPRFFDRRYFFSAPDPPLLEDQTFYGLILSDRSRSWRMAVAGILNCSLTYLHVETFGRSSLGDGVRQYALCDMNALPVLDPGVVASRALEGVIQAYRPLSTRRILPVEDEMCRADRLELDKAVTEAFGIKERQIATARRALVDLTRQRLERARSMK